MEWELCTFPKLKLKRIPYELERTGICSRFFFSSKSLFKNSSAQSLAALRMFRVQLQFEPFCAELTSLSGYSSFLPQSKSIHNKLTGDSKLCECVQRPLLEMSNGSFIFGIVVDEYFFFSYVNMETGFDLPWTHKSKDGTERNHFPISKTNSMFSECQLNTCLLFYRFYYVISFLKIKNKRR